MPRRASLWATLLIALAGVAIVATLRHHETPSSVAVSAPSEALIDAHERNVTQTAVEVVEPLSHDSAQPVGEADYALPRTSGMEAFLELREVPVVVLRNDLDELAAEPRDSNWSTEMETLLQSEIAQASLTLTDSYVECRTSRCIVALVRPTGAYDQKETVGLPNGPISRRMRETAQALGLQGSQASQILARNGALVHWQRFFRRCAPDWTCAR
jgi:hypothetical protein